MYTKFWEYYCDLSLHIPKHQGCRGNILGCVKPLIQGFKHVQALHAESSHRREPATRVSDAHHPGLDWLPPPIDSQAVARKVARAPCTYSQRLADWSAWVNPNLRGILAGGGGWVVCCTGSNSTDQLVSITHILMCCNAWRDHLVKPFKPSRHSPLQLGGYLLLFFVCNKLQSSWSVRAWEALSHYHHFTNTQWCI